jgi:S-adenosylmethionine synthetase
LYINTYGTSKVKASDAQIARVIEDMKEFDMRPYYIEHRFNLRSPIYSETAAYGHMGRKPVEKVKNFMAADGKTIIKKKVLLFPWEVLNNDIIRRLRSRFGLKGIA